MREYIEIGSSPCDEDCAQVGSENYEARAKEECRRYIGALRATLGEEPEGAHLQVKGNAHDFGTYYEVVCWYDEDIQESVDYAFKCESDGPMTWPEGYRTPEEYKATKLAQLA
jgi:hypothetical protein